MAFKVTQFDDDNLFSELAGFNYFTIILILEGDGQLLADTSSTGFTGNSLMTFSLYQQFQIRSNGRMAGIVVNFHPDFFCLHQHRNEVSCNGILFNNIYDSPLTILTGDEAESLRSIMMGMITEMHEHGLSEPEVLLAYLKILLINGSRIKLGKSENENLPARDNSADRSRLNEAIEHNFRKLHGPADYAKLLNLTPVVLNRLSRKLFNKTFSALVTERIIIEAKRQLYLTAKPIKLIAFELGFNDEFYFSRYFKTNVKVSPQLFRDTVGFDKAN